jgi:hypothetical protein
MTRLLWLIFKFFVVLVAAGILLSFLMGGIGLVLGLAKPLIIIIVVVILARLLFRR